MEHELDAEAIRQLLDPAAWPAVDEPPQLIETHISWVILAGEFAYKIKKPVSLGFLDFSTRALRKHYCEEELRLNRRTAPELYLDVVSIGRTHAGLRVGAEPVVDYAVKMRRFPEEARLDHGLRAGRLGPVDMRELAAMIADFHDRLAPSINRDAAFAAERASKPVLNNFTYLRENLGRRGPPQLERVEDWTSRQIEALRPVFAARAAGGFVRECHGDLHLANLLRLEGRFRAFDCIEFDEGLRRIDIVNDMAFLVMDLEHRGRDDYARRFLNKYLEHTGDYAGLGVFSYYLAYRALVRAKVDGIRLRQESTDAG
ncbi:MAG: phosphotransferase, partial [Xanthomonadales bacterium]|nr:phosphotransferase [Xanthomonadales bacterium]